MSVFDIFEEMKPAFTTELLKDTFTEFFNADSERMEKFTNFIKMVADIKNSILKILVKLGISYLQKNQKIL
jgi:hypothetical protein